MERVHKTFVLTKNDKILGTFGNLRKVTKFVKDKDFYSYWTLIRMKTNPIECNNYKIFKVKHY